VARIFIVDDDPVCAKLLPKFIAREGHEVKSATNGHEAVEVGTKFRPDLLLADFVLNDSLDGLDVARALRESNPNMTIFVMSGFPAEFMRRKADSVDVANFFQKPLNYDELFDAIRVALNHEVHERSGSQ
jgi:DNA-binding response OmpR family regulator